MIYGVRNIKFTEAKLEEAIIELLGEHSDFLCFRGLLLND